MIWANEAGVSVYIYEAERERRVVEVHGLVDGCETVLATATIEKHNRESFSDAIAPDVGARTKLIRGMQRNPSDHVTAVMASPAPTADAAVDARETIHHHPFSPLGDSIYCAWVHGVGDDAVCGETEDADSHKYSDAPIPPSPPASPEGRAQAIAYLESICAEPTEERILLAEFLATEPTVDQIRLATSLAINQRSRAPVVEQWQPIESATCDDERVLVYYEDGGINTEDLDHDSDPAWWHLQGARYFMRLPDPPKEQTPKETIQT
jgi:hypothetical protein